MKFTFLREVTGHMPSLLGTLKSFWHRAGGNAVCPYQIESLRTREAARSCSFVRRILENKVNLLRLVSSFVWITGTTSLGDIQWGRSNVWYEVID